jgi:NADPH-dependent curcumin reductase
MRRNVVILMKRHPRGPVSEDDFEVDEEPLSPPGDGEVLVRNLWLSLDPYMRLRMDPVRSYVDHLRPGDVMPGGAVGTVIASHGNDVPVGATVVGTNMGWQTYSRRPASAVRLVEERGVPISTALGVVGMPGVTAHYGLLMIGRPKPGETVVVSAASGAVGSVAGQIARLKGCRVVGIAGGPAKCRSVVEELGFDTCVDHRADDFEAQLAASTPDRVDIDFENVGGRVMDAVLGRLNHHARIVLCGLVSEYDERPGAGLQRTRELLVNRAQLQAFIISEYPQYWPTALDDLARWVSDGSIKYREHVTEGLLNAPKAFIAMLKGQTFGKTLVRIVEHDRE